MTVVVGLVPTPEGVAALRAAITEARRRSQPLVVVNASRGDRAIDRGLLDDDAWARTRADLDASGIPFEVRQPVEARPIAESLVSTAEEVGAELIVIGIRRRSPVGKLLLGSTASSVLLEASCPVLAVKAE